MPLHKLSFNNNPVRILFQYSEIPCKITNGHLEFFSPGIFIIVKYYASKKPLEVVESFIAPITFKLSYIFPGLRSRKGLDENVMFDVFEELTPGNMSPLHVDQSLDETGLSNGDIICFTPRTANETVKDSQAIPVAPAKTVIPVKVSKMATSVKSSKKTIKVTAQKKTNKSAETQPAAVYADAQAPSVGTYFEEVLAEGFYVPIADFESTSTHPVMNARILNAPFKVPKPVKKRQSTANENHQSAINLNESVKKRQKKPSFNEPVKKRQKKPKLKVSSQLQIEKDQLLKANHGHQDAMSTPTDQLRLIATAEGCNLQSSVYSNGLINIKSTSTISKISDMRALKNVNKKVQRQVGFVDNGQLQSVEAAKVSPLNSGQNAQNKWPAIPKIKVKFKAPGIVPTTLSSTSAVGKDEDAEPVTIASAAGQNLKISLYNTGSITITPRIVNREEIKPRFLLKFKNTTLASNAGGQA
jgi:ICP0-binding domain of Ubiquitin-specific protease 7